MGLLPMSFEEYASYDGLGLAELVRYGEVTPVELVEEAAARIGRHNPTLNAIFHDARDEAAAVAAGGLPDGPFRGVPFLIKDLGSQVKGWPRTSGSRFVQHEVDDADDRLVTRYRKSGAVLMGKTNTPEFGITGTTESALLGPCRNPWNPDHISGGSSGGSAAATAAGIVPLAHASDGLGSIRIPAACCGLFGMKVTRERNPSGPHDGNRVLGFSVDHVVSRTVRDSAAMLDWTGYAEPASPYAAPMKNDSYLNDVQTDPGALRIAFSTETPSGRPIDPEVEAVTHATATLLTELGHRVEERGLGVDYRALYRAQGVCSAANAAANYRELVERVGREAEEDELEPLTWAGIRVGQKLTGEQVMVALRQLRELNRSAMTIFEDVDVFLSPVMGTPAPPVGYIDPVNLEPREVSKRQAKVFPFTPPFNFTGQPAMSVPLAQSGENLPIGMQFAGRYGDEATLFRLAAQLEHAQPWRERTPALWN